MSGQNIALLAVLVVLVAVCFSSGLIARKLRPDDAAAQAKTSLFIKLGATLVALALYLVVFLILK